MEATATNAVLLFGRGTDLAGKERKGKERKETPKSIPIVYC
jgi:hypothetical protein